MYRFSGLVTLLIGAALVYSLAFTSWNQKTESYYITPDGTVTREKIECPPPWDLLFGDANVTGLLPSHVRLCSGVAKILITEAIIVAAVSMSLGIWGIIRGPRPPIRPIEVLPSVAAQRRRATSARR
ncbi:MAG TPA: hypothetical protein EYP73_03770 [Acidimicrobiia bacterium]|nr:hypothetical protein [Acidimicrobiia bacterium]